MAGAPKNLGTGTTITFGTSGFTAELLAISWSGLTRDTVDVSHMSTSAPGAGKMANRPFLAGKLVDPGEISGSFHFDADKIPPIDGVEELITITFPLIVGDTTPSKWACQGSLTAYDPDIPLDDKMTAAFTIKLSGEITVTVAT